jgi:hypothetical protein
MDDAFLEADASTRFKLVALAVTVLALILLTQLTSPTAPPDGVTTPAAFKQSLDRLLIDSLIVVPLFAGASVYLIRLGLKVSRSGQYPPPGMRVPVRTRIRRGARARWNAILIFVVAGVSMVPGPVLVYAYYSLSHLMTDPAPSGRPALPAPRNGAAGPRR